MSISQNFPTIRPTLNLNFARSKRLDPRITFTRASTATYVDEDGLIKTASADEARFDHDPVTGESLGLLIEESRTNLYDNTINFGSSNWVLQTSPEVTLNTTDVSSPDGTYSAVKWTPTTTLSQYVYDQVGSLGLSLTYTMSVWVRTPEGESTTFQMNLYAPTQQSPVLTATDTWKRFTWTFTPQNQVSAYPVIVRELNKSLYIWGPQIEVGSFPTSYIPTSGSTVTRMADSVLISPSGWWNYSKGTVYAEFKGGLESQQSGYGRIWSPSGASALSARISHTINNSATIWFGGSAPSITSQDHLNSFGKIAVSYSNNGTSADIVMGSYPVTTTGTTNQLTNTTTPHGIGKNAGSNTNMLNGYIKKLVYYPEVLTSSQLQNLTK